MNPKKIGQAKCTHDGMHEAITLFFKKCTKRGSRPCIAYLHGMLAYRTPLTTSKSVKAAEVRSGEMPRELI